MPSISVITRVELENGVYRDPTQAESRRARLGTLLAAINIVDFIDKDAARFGKIVKATGYSRRTNDRMIAATALLHDAVFITMNSADYVDIPALKLEVWDNPAA